MNTVAAIYAAGLGIAIVAAPAMAQMGGGMMPSGGAAPNRFFEDRSMTMSATEKRNLAACQAMAADEMAKDKKCDRLQKKADHIAGKS